MTFRVTFPEALGVLLPEGAERVERYFIVLLAGGGVEAVGVEIDIGVGEGRVEIWQSLPIKVCPVGHLQELVVES